MTMIYTLLCPQCDRQQNFATKKKEILFENRIFNCSCGWSGKAQEGRVRERIYETILRKVKLLSASLIKTVL